MADGFFIIDSGGGGSGDVEKVGTPADSQVGVWTGDGTIEGAASFTYDGSNMFITGDIGSTGTRITKGWFIDFQVTNAIAADITGTAAVATTVTITDEESTNEENEIPFVDNAAAPGNNGLASDSGFTYNPSTGRITVAGIGATTLVTPTIVSTGFTNANHAHAAANSGGQLTGTASVIWGNWKTFYSNGSGVSTEVALGAQYTLYMSNGAAAAPTWSSTLTGTSINFSAAANLQVGGSQIDFDDMAGAANIATTGTIAGHVPQGADIASSPVNLNTTDLHGKMYKFTVAATVNLDAAADAGFGACSTFRIRDAAEAAILDLDGSEKFNLRGTAQAAGVGITATGAGEHLAVCATTDTDGSGTDGYDVWGPTAEWASQ